MPSMPYCSGTGMLTCVPPFLSQTLVAHTLKNYIKVDTNIIFVLFDIFVITKIMAISQGIPGHLCGNPLPHPLCRQYWASGHLKLNLNRWHWWTCKRWRRFFHRFYKDHITAGGSSDSLGGKPYGSSAWHRRRKQPWWASSFLNEIMTVMMVITMVSI